MKNGFKNFLIYLLVPSLLAVIFYNFVSKNLILSNILFYLLLSLYFYMRSKDDLADNFRDFKQKWKTYLPIIMKYTISCFILMMLINYLIQLVIPDIPVNEMNNRSLIQDNLFLALVYLLVVAPCLEEYVFRYSFKEIKSYTCYVLITSLLFALLHLLSISNIKEILYVFAYFTIGFGFSNIFFKTKNYYASLIGHIIHNALCVIIILLF